MLKEQMEEAFKVRTTSGFPFNWTVITVSNVLQRGSVQLTFSNDRNSPTLKYSDVLSPVLLR